MSDLDEFEQRIKNALDASAYQLDAATKQQLYANRRAIFQQHKPRLMSIGWLSAHRGWSFSGLALSSVLVAVLVFGQFNTKHHHGDMVSDQIAVLELMENPDETDAISDPAFYLWLDETQTSKTHA